MRVLLADAHPEVRWALRTAIGEEPGFTLVGEVVAAEDLLALARALRPDVILLEWELPGGPVQDLLAILRAHAPELSVIVLGRQPGFAQTALVAGADAYVSKANGPEQLLEALHSLELR
jgi:DNA-binding NarL/FixJ family response regulator